MPFYLLGKSSRILALSLLMQNCKIASGKAEMNTTEIDEQFFFIY
jgi:hypothetical protein